jgi:hypothetical protein
MNRDLTATQHDYAHFLPALSGFYATYVGKQRHPDPVKGPYIPDARIPANFANGVESLNYLNAQEGAFTYKWTLYSAGHADLDTTKFVPKEDMVRNRDRDNTWLLGDSGGFQIGKGVWEGEWKDPTSQFIKDKMADCVARGTEERIVTSTDKNGNEVTKTVTVDLVKEYQSRLDMAQKKRDAVLRWMDAYADYGMILDIPAWVSRSPAGALATGISEYQDAVEATKYNNEYWMKHRTGACKFLNVLQGENHADADDWYEQMKDYCDPVKYPDNHFNGWSMGGQNMCDVHLVLKRIVSMHFDGLLQSGVHDVMHFLGTSKLEWACLLTDVQRAIRKYYNPTMMLTFDCASPFLATANGQIYIQNETPDRGKWTYRMVPSIDDKKYSIDTRTFKQAVLQDGIFKNFEDSPITAEMKVSDVCIYKPGDLNKIGKEGKTSWDSFSYAIQMGHNVWSHINAVQEANRQYDAGVVPAMLVQEQFDRVFFRDVVEQIFAAKTREEANALIDNNSKFWMSIPGTRGAIGKKTVNSSTYFGSLFDVVETEVDVPEEGCFTEDQEHLLENLENEQL